MKHLHLLLLYLLPALLPAQERIRVAHACSYRGENLLSDYFTFAPSTEADRIVQEICDAQGLAKNFIVKSANVPNALATIESDGRRVILYSTLFLEKFKADSRTRCADTPGLKQYEGCPDTDSDGVPDPDDKCPKEAGLAALQGCPEPKPATKSTPLPAGGGDGGGAARAGDLAADGLVFVPGGTFTMGCTTEQESECDSDEKPVRKVTLSDFFIGKYEVTQKQWRDVMGTNPSYFKDCDNCPVENVSWNDVQDFLQKINAANPGKNYRLPSQAEWEYAARGGSLTKNYKYAGGNSIDDVAWCASNSGSKTHPVGGKKNNKLGIHDMSGNVWEWCNDWKGAYPSGAETNPTGPGTGVVRVYRGGSWFNDSPNCRVSFLAGNVPSYRFSALGFRLCRSR